MQEGCYSNRGGSQRLASLRHVDDSALFEFAALPQAVHREVRKAAKLRAFHPDPEIAALAYRWAELFLERHGRRLRVSELVSLLGDGLGAALPHDSEAVELDSTPFGRRYALTIEKLGPPPGL